MQKYPTTPLPTSARNTGRYTPAKSDHVQEGSHQQGYRAKQTPWTCFDHREERYAKEESFDWFKTYEDLKPLLSQHIASKDSRILMLGCGNSSKKLLPLMELAFHLEWLHTFSDQLLPSTFCSSE